MGSGNTHVLGVRSETSKAFIAEYDLGRPVQAIRGIKGYTQVMILVRNHGSPIDIIWLSHDPGKSSLSGQNIEKEVHDRLGITPTTLLGFNQKEEAPPELFPPVSVIVCTRDRPQYLRLCLASLARRGNVSSEVIVVDNASASGETREITANSGFRYIREERPGLNWARNRGAEEATYDIVAYVDDDAHVDGGWLREIARPFLRDEIDAVTGLVLPAELETIPQFLFELYGGMGKGFGGREFHGILMSPYKLIKVQEVGVGANMAIRKRTLERVGGFDTSLDVGTPSRGGGDLDMFHRILAGGGVLRYEPRALVWHRHRSDMDSLLRQLSCNGRSYGVYLMKIWKNKTVRGLHVVSFVVSHWGPSLVGRFFLSMLRRHRLPIRMVWAELWGALHAPWAYLATHRYDSRIRKQSNA